VATRPSNLERNMRTLALADIQPDDRVLEIGFGPGIAIERAAELANRGKVFGVDHFELMLRQVSRRNATALAAGRVELRLGTAERLPGSPNASIRSPPQPHAIWRSDHVDLSAA
jgi:ubiquinone/menaquinone biosynthesis C-methylase UbiE